MNRLFAMLLLSGFLLLPGRADAITCWYTLAPDIDGSTVCQRCSTAPGGYPKYEPFSVIKCFYGCLNCQIIPPLHGDAAPYCEAAGGGSLVKEDATKAVPMHFEDALQGADWERLIEASPAHALFFLGAKAKADGGEPINVRDWHVATPFLPTKGVVHLMQGGNATPDLLEKASDPVASNQTVKVEVRGRELDRSTIELDLATVLQTHLDGGEKTEDVLEIRTYRLVRVGDAAAPRSDHSGVSSRADIGRYVVASIDGEKADLSTVAPY